MVHIVSINWERFKTTQSYISKYWPGIVVAIFQKQVFDQKFSKAQVLLNSKAHQLGWLKTQNIVKILKYVLTKFKLLNYIAIAIAVTRPGLYSQCIALAI